MSRQPRIDFRPVGKPITNPCYEILLDEFFKLTTVTWRSFSKYATVKEKIYHLESDVQSDMKSPSDYEELDSFLDTVAHFYKGIIAENSVHYSSFTIRSHPDENTKLCMMGEFRYLKSAKFSKDLFIHEVTGQFPFLIPGEIEIEENQDGFPEMNSILFVFDVEVTQSHAAIKEIHAECVILDTRFPARRSTIRNERIEYVRNVMRENSHNPQMIKICREYLTATPFARTILDKSITLAINQERNRYRIVNLSQLKSKPRSIRRYQKL